MDDEARIFIRATQYDGSPHWDHDAFLVQASDGLVITRTEAGTPVTRGDGRTYVSPYNTRAHYWSDRWFNVIRLEVPGRGLNGFYCNISSPATFDGLHLRYTDLQLDVRAYTTEGGGLRYEVVDEDEFQAGLKRYAYPDDLVAHCRAAVEELISLIETREFPFDLL